MSKNDLRRGRRSEELLAKTATVDVRVKRLQMLQELSRKLLALQSQSFEQPCRLKQTADLSVSEYISSGSAVQIF